MTNERLFFFEQTDFSLRFARCVISDTGLNVEELKELPLGDEAGLGQLAPAGTPVVCALRPRPRQLRLTTADEGRLHAGLAGLLQFARLPEFSLTEPAWLAACQASDGAAPDATPSLLSLSSAAAQQQSRQSFEALKLKPARCLDATLASVGAFATSAGGPFLLLEIGELSSHALLVVSGKVIAVRKVGLNLDQIAEAVRLELNLKFRGAAAKLFFNPDCDFSETGPKVSDRIAAALKPELAPLLAGHATPVALCCTGLPAAQHWFEIELGRALGLALHEPDAKTWSASVGLTFASPALAAGLASSWFNFLHFINAQTLDSPEGSAWQAEWQTLPAPQPSKPTPVPSSISADGNSARPAAGQIVSPPAPQPAPPPAKTTPAAPVTIKPAATPTPKPAVASPPAAAKTATPSLHYSTQPAKPERSADGSGPARKSKSPLLIGLAILIVALLAGYFYLDSRNAELARVALEKKQTEERLKAEGARARLAESQARAEAENRKQFELETSRKLALAEAAREQAEAEARNQTAVRLANARGTLVVTTEPAGALVTVGDLPAKPSPATFTLIKIGKYPITLTLAHHEEVRLEAEVTENSTTETGPVVLPSLVGSLSLTSEPTGFNYEIRPAHTFRLTDGVHRTGQTPATIADLDPGEYTVTFSRPGWTAHTETVSVARSETTQAAWTFPSGMVKLSSNPSGATVLRDGVQVGQTPLLLSQPPGAARYELQLPRYDSLTLTGQIVEGKTTVLTAQLHPADVVYGASELDSHPEPINPKIPELPPQFTLTEGKVVVQLTIMRDGSPSDLKIVRASNPDIGKIYLAALAKWKFKPGMKAGTPVRSTVVIPFLIQPAQD